MPKLHEREVHVDLGDVLLDRRPLLVEDVADVDPGRDRVVGDEHLRTSAPRTRRAAPASRLGRRARSCRRRALPVARSSPAAPTPAWPARRTSAAPRRLASARPVASGELLRVPAGVAGPRNGPDRDVVGPDVVGMAVAAEVVVGRDDIGLVLADEPHEPAGGVVEVGLPEVPRIAGSPAGPSCPSRGSRGSPTRSRRGRPSRLQLARPDLAQPAVVVGRVHLLDDDLAHLAAGAGDEDDAVAGRTALAIVPPVPIVSSSGWAWTVMSVRRLGRAWPPWYRRWSSECHRRMAR